MIRVAIVGTRGIPNNYGGFETLAEYLTAYLSEELQLTVYCSSRDMDSSLTVCNGAQLAYIPISSHGFWGIIYDSICLLKAIKKNDKILMLGFGTGFLMPFLRTASKKKLIINIGGLDWKREKWSWFARKVIKISEGLLFRYCSKFIADNIGIQQYIVENYQKESYLIAYGGDQAQKVPISPEALKKYPFLANPYCFSVARIQADNNIVLILDAFTTNDRLPIVFVGNWNNSAYGQKIKEQFGGQDNLILLDAIYDRKELDLLRSNCTIYIHGHSAGGTNPSLVEAMYLGLPVFAFKSVYNQFTTEEKALYFSDSKTLSKLVNEYSVAGLFLIAKDLQNIAAEKYTWKLITEQYKEIFCSI